MNTYDYDLTTYNVDSEILGLVNGSSRDQWDAFLLDD